MIVASELAKERLKRLAAVHRFSRAGADIDAMHAAEPGARVGASERELEDLRIFDGADALLPADQVHEVLPG